MPRFGPLAVLLIALSISMPNAMAETIVYVAPTGDDSADGSREHPLRSPLKARNLVRTIKPKATGPIQVQFSGGTYYLDAPLVFTPADSGTAESQVIYTAAHGEEVVLSGGKKLDLTWIPEGKGVYHAEVSVAQTDKLPFEVDQLFLNGQPMRMARYPNYDPKARNYGGTAADAIALERIAKWANPIGGFVHALHRHEWGGFHYRITGVEPDGKSLKLDGGFQNNRRMGMHPVHRFVENIREELDAPGEWFFDKSKETLYVIPPTGVDLKSAVVEVAGIPQLIKWHGTREHPVQHVSIRGLTLTHTARTFMLVKEPLLRSDWCIYRGGAAYLERTEDCRIIDCGFRNVGGNAVFISGYNRLADVTGCAITEAGASGICLVGDPSAVRSPSFEYNEFVPLDKMDLEPGPQSPDYPARCRIHDNLIQGIGRVEKQVAGVEIAMAQDITVSHNTINDAPRAGVNIGDGCWGGHVIEFNDVFDTVKETGDHGAFNSWGRDRYWHPNRETMNAIVAKDPAITQLDAVKLTVIRNNRWRCDHGWDIDLDDGSSFYTIKDNLCLNGGIKLREGFNRLVANNIMVNNTFHPHVWFEKSGDIFSNNIVMTPYAPIGMPKVWGALIGFNLLPDNPTLEDSRKEGHDARSAAGDPKFLDPGRGDYRVAEDSPAIKVSFDNFSMNQFGVISPSLRAEARTPKLPSVDDLAKLSRKASERDGTIQDWLGARVKNIVGEGEVSAAGLPSETGVLIVEAPADCRAAKAGIKKGDVILKVGDVVVSDVADLLKQTSQGNDANEIRLEVFRDQNRIARTVGTRAP